VDSFAHEAVVALIGASTSAAPGGAVTVALCGHWEHQGACPWAHNTSVVTRDEASVTVRVEFSCDEDDEHHVRRLIRRALQGGAVVGPNGCETWTLIDDRIVA
jgi:hypothetical protein